MRIKLHITLFLIVIYAILFVAMMPHAEGATTAAWDVDNSGWWTTDSNWDSGNAPGGIDDVANFGDNITQDRTIAIVFSSPDVGTLTIDSDKSYTISQFFGRLDISVTGQGTGTITINESGNTTTHTISSGVRLYDDVDIDVNSGTLVMSGGISQQGGDKLLNKTGNGTLILSGNNTYQGDTVVTAGTLEIGNSNVIDDASDLVLSGGTFNTNGFSETLGSLTLTEDSIIDLSNGSSYFNFDEILDAAFVGTLHIYNWTGTEGSSGGTDQLIFGSHGSFTKFSQIQFYSDSGTTLLGQAGFIGDELAPIVPEPSTVVMSSLLLLLIIYRSSKKYFGE